MRDLWSRRVLPGALFFLAAASADLRAQTWWDPAYGYRRQVTVATGATSPTPGYNGYTVRVSGFDTAALVTAGKMLASGDDLRVLYWNGGNWTELARDLLGMNGAATDLRFKLQATITASSSTGAYYLYYGNAAAGAPPAVTTTNVYLWWDDASADLTASYITGRVDDTGHGGTTVGSSITHDVAGYYLYSAGDNITTSMRPLGISERDVYVEYEFFQTNAFPQDMTSGPLTRLTVAGSGDTETSNGHYFYLLGDSTFQTTPYAQHGDLTFTNRTQDIDGTDDTLVEVAASTWLKAALASWSVNATNLKGFYDATPSAAERGGFGAAAATTKTHAAGSDVETAGETGAWIGQDAGRLRNMLVRRYVEPEPTTSLGAEIDQATAALPAISLSPPTLTFTAPLFGSNPAAQDVTISNPGGTALNWTATHPALATWLGETPASGTVASGATGTMSVSVNISGLAMGTYNSTITVSDPTASNNPQTVTVTLNITTATVPVIGLNPTSLTFNAPQGGPDPASQNVTVSNAGGGTLTWSAAEALTWLSLTPAGGTLGSGAGQAMTVSVNVSGLVQGTYNGTITVSDPAAPNTPQTIPVTLIVGPRPPRSSAPNGDHSINDACSGRLAAPSGGAIPLGWIALLLGLAAVRRR